MFSQRTATPDPPQIGQVVDGVVKSWNGSRGFGFIASQGMVGDVMFLRNVLPVDCKEVRGTFLEGKTVRFEVQPGNAGKVQAANIQIMPGDNTGEQLAGKVRTWSDSDSCGYIETSMLPGVDVFFTRDEVDNLLPGADLTDQLVIFQASPDAEGNFVASQVMFQSVKIAKDFKALGMGGGNKRGHSDMGGNDFGNQFAVANGNSHSSHSNARRGNDNAGGGTISQEMAAQMITMFATVMQAMNNNSNGNNSNNNNDQQGYAPKRQKTHSERNTDATSTGQHASGLVKSYNPSKGFGFIDAPTLTSDVMFMKHDLPLEAQNEDIKGCAVNFEVMQKTDGKLCARNITSG